MRFALNNKSFDSVKGKIGNTDKSLEISRYNDEFSLYSHEGDTVTEIACFTKEELHTIWVMMTEK